MLRRTCTFSSGQVIPWRTTHNGYGVTESDDDLLGELTSGRKDERPGALDIEIEVLKNGD